MNLIFIAIGFNSFLLHAALAYPGGAPESVCGSMTPKKSAHGSDPQQTQSPYQVTADKSYYKAGMPVKVTIKSTGADMFKGILVQAREVGKDTPIGTFSDSLPPNVKHLECTGPKRAVTHKNSLNLADITLNWSPPGNVSEMGNVSFFATVVKNKATFWIKLKSDELYNKMFAGINSTAPNQKITSMAPEQKKPTHCGASIFSSSLLSLFFSLTLLFAAHHII